jgi:hypothetical protein
VVKFNLLSRLAQLDEPKEQLEILRILFFEFILLKNMAFVVPQNIAEFRENPIT